MSFPSETYTDVDIKKIVESGSDGLKEISEELESAEKKAVKEREGESPVGDSSTKNEDSIIEENINHENNEVKENSFPYDWLVEYNYPETLHNLIISLDIKKDQFLSLQIEDLNNHSEVYKKIKSMQKEKYDEWEKIAKDDMLRDHALETLVNGYSELNEKFDLINLNSEAQLKTLNEVDELMSSILEKGKEEVGKTTGVALDLVSGAMENQIKEFRKTFIEENEARKEFFKNEYTQLKEGLDKAIKDSNIKNAINKTTILLFVFMIITQMIILGILGFIYQA